MGIKKYIIFDVSEIDKINFNEVFESSKDSIRISNSNKTFVKYNGSMPKSIQTLETKSQEYSQDEMMVILSNDEWKINVITYSGSTE